VIRQRVPGAAQHEVMRVFLTVPDCMLIASFDRRKRRRDLEVPEGLDDRADLEARRLLRSGTRTVDRATPAYNRVLGPDPTNMMEVGMESKRVVGVDIGKRWVDVAREGTARVGRHRNEAVDIAVLVATFDASRDLVVFERCGGYERHFEAALGAAGIPWAVVHSAAVKAFRQVQGIKAKTDAIDARLLRDFGRDRLDAGKLRLGRTEDVVLDALVARHRQLKAALHAEQCRRETAAIAAAQASIERMIAHLQAELVTVGVELSLHESSDPQIVFKEAVMCQRKGVAQATARALLAELPELGRVECKQITALGGLAPRIHQSGRTHPRRGLVPGRASVKAILFNPARSAMRWDPEIRTFCNRLRARGKPGKVIMVAVMRKLLVRLNAAVRDALNQPEVLSPATRMAV